MKGMRVQSIIRELKGEKIDIIEFNEDVLSFAANALSPAKINHVSIVDMEEKRLEVIVDDTQLSLAIGKKGQNVRLAAKLLGWHIDIKSEEEKRQEIESQMAEMARRGASIVELTGLGEKTIERLQSHGIETVEQLARMTPDELTEIPGVGEKTVERIRKVVTDYFEEGQAPVEEEAAEAEAAAGQAPLAEPAPELGAESFEGQAATAEAIEAGPAEVEVAETESTPFEASEEVAAQVAADGGGQGADETVAEPEIGTGHQSGEEDH